MPYGTDVDEPARCPVCATVVRDLQSIAWGYCWGPRGTAFLSGYKVGDRVRWARISDGRVPTWMAFGMHDANVGSPGMDVAVVDFTYSGSDCPSCGVHIPTIATVVKDGLISEVLAVTDGPLADPDCEIATFDEHGEVRHAPWMSNRSLSVLVEDVEGAIEPDDHVRLSGFRHWDELGQLVPDDEVRQIEDLRARLTELPGGYRGESGSRPPALIEHRIYRDDDGRYFVYDLRDQSAAARSVPLRLEVPPIHESLTEVAAADALDGVRFREEIAALGLRILEHLGP